VQGSTYLRVTNSNCTISLVHQYNPPTHPKACWFSCPFPFLQEHKCSCVQGSTYLRVINSLLALIINAEFFVTHFVIFPAQQAASGTGFFGGSNALWVTEVLRRQVYSMYIYTYVYIYINPFGQKSQFRRSRPPRALVSSGGSNTLWATEFLRRQVYSIYI